jgi:Spy/CpxP family protein refolding chaperone
LSVPRCARRPKKFQKYSQSLPTESDLHRKFRRGFNIIIAELSISIKYNVARRRAMRVRMILIPSLIAVLALGLAAAQADPGQMGKGGKRGGDAIGREGGSEFGPGPGWGRGMHRGLYGKLGLTKEQKKEMRALVAGFLDTTRSARTAKMTLKDEKRAMIISGKIDPKRLAAIDEELVKAKAQIMTERLKMKRAKLEMLTDEQKDLLGDFMARKAMKKGHRGKHQGKHGGRF